MLLHERGYAACGVREITQAAGVPLGSFTNHFLSKEAFAAVVLDRYMATLLAVVTRTLRDESREPLKRISAYFDAIGEIAAPLEWRFGCMVANLGFELPQHSEAVRAQLVLALSDLTGPFAEALREGQASGHVRDDIAADDLALITLSAWHGTLLRAKVDQRGDAPRMFARTLPVLLGKTSASDAGAAAEYVGASCQPVPIPPSHAGQRADVTSGLSPQSPPVM